MQILIQSWRFKDQIKELGAKEVYLVNDNMKLSENTDLIDIINAGGFNAIIDPFFDIYFTEVIDFLAMDGKYITCGLRNHARSNKTDNDTQNLKSLFTKIMLKNISIIGNCIGTIDDGLTALNDYRQGNFSIVIDQIYKKGEESLFFDRTFNSKKRFGKVVYMY